VGIKRKKVQLPGAFLAHDSLKWWAMSSLAILAVAVLEYAGLLQWMRSLGNAVTQPLRQATVQLGQHAIYQVNFARVALKKYTYVLDLELRYAEAAAQLGEIQQLKSENEQLKHQLSASATQSGEVSHRQFAPVISYTQPTIGSGSVNGVEIGKLVFVSGVAIGRVSLVERQEASIQLFSEHSVHEVIIAQTESGVSGILNGSGGQVRLEELPIEANVHEGERVITTGQVGVRPGVYLGRIKEIRRQEGAATQEAVLDEGVSFYRSAAVEVEQ